MLSPEENVRLTQGGLGTPMGETLRRYWLPALTSEEVAEADGAPVRVRILGENLIGFRDSAGKVGLLGEFCPHRGASLLYGRNEENGIRCLYHGWKFDVEGRTLETPNEPAGGRPFEGRLRQGHYPTREAAGAVWTYMGPPDREPPFPEYPFVTRKYAVVAKVFLDCSYLQSLEGGIDSSHLSFLHRTTVAADQGQQAVDDATPRLELEDTPYGFRYAAVRDGNEGQQYIRITPVVMPSMTVVPFPPHRPQMSHFWVPIDDEHNYVYTFNWNANDEPLATGQGSQGYEMAGRFTRTRTRSNQHLQDRLAMKDRSWTGIERIPDQDAMIQESMIPIVDRSQEHLGRADMAVVRQRTLLLAATRAVEDGGAPLGIDCDFPVDQIRSVVAEVPSSTPWQELGLPERTTERNVSRV